MSLFHLFARLLFLGPFPKLLLKMPLILPMFVLKHTLMFVLKLMLMLCLHVRLTAYVMFLLTPTLMLVCMLTLLSELSACL